MLAWARSLAGKEFSVVLDEDANISLMIATSDINLFTDCYKWHYFVLLYMARLGLDGLPPIRPIVSRITSRSLAVVLQRHKHKRVVVLLILVQHHQIGYCLVTNYGVHFVN